jgi:hypothetical protein
MQTIQLEQTLVDSLKMEFDTPNIKEAIMKMYQFYIANNTQNIKNRALIEANTEMMARDIIRGIKDIKDGKTRNIKNLFDEL